LKCITGSYEKIEVPESFDQGVAGLFDGRYVENIAENTGAANAVLPGEGLGLGLGFVVVGIQDGDIHPGGGKAVRECLADHTGAAGDRHGFVFQVFEEDYTMSFNQQ
jgi:hypothetical protein